MGYIRPVPLGRLTSWAVHKRRNPPSQEAGTDYFCPRFTPIAAAENGRISDTGDSIGPATGRFVTIDLDDGRRVRYLHLESRLVKVGDRVRRGQIIAYSGATGYGDADWSWNVWETGGAHVHMTLWPSHRYVFGTSGTLDPEAYMSDNPTPASSGAKPLPTESEATTEEEDDMKPLILSSSVGQSLVIPPVIVHLATADEVNDALKAGYPVFETRPSLHSRILEKYDESIEDVTTLSVVYGDPGGTVYTFDGQKLEPVYDPTTLPRLLELPGVRRVEWSAAEIAARITAQNAAQ